MFKDFAPLRLVALLVVLASPVLVRAQTLADRVPADTTLYFGWQGVDSPGPGFAGSHLEAVLADSNIPKVIEEFLPKVLDRIAQEDKQAAEGIEIARALLGPMYRHPSAIAIVGIDLNAGPAPKALLLCDAGNEAAALKAKIDDLLKMAGQPPFPVHVVERGGLIALIIGYAKPEDGLIDAGPAGKSLANNPAFTKALAQVGKNGFITGYVDVEKIAGLADLAAGFAPPDVQKNWAKAREMLGIKSIQRAIWTEGFDGKDWASQVFVASPEPRSGFLGSLVNGKPLTQELFHSIPENVTLAGGVHFDLAGLVSAIRGAVASIDDNAGKQIEQGIGQINQVLGLDIEKDFFGNLGDEWAYYLDPAVTGDSLLGATVINRLKDPAKAEATFTKLEEFINQLIANETQKEKEKVTVAFRQAKLGGTTVHYLGFPFITPAWAVQNGNLYLALYPEVVAAAAAHVPGQGKSILDNPSYEAVMQKLGNHPYSSFGYVDVPRMAPLTYGTWMAISHMANAGDLFGIPAPLAILPPLAKLMPHLSALGQCTWTDADGMHFKGHASFPGAQIFATDPTSMSIGQVAVLTSLMLPALAKTREQAQHVKSSANLHQIGMGAIQFSNTHNGKYPKDLGELMAESGLSVDAFVDPSSGTAAPPGLAPEQAQAWVRQNSDYIWNGAGKSADKLGADDALAWENPERAKNGINILFGDYHVEFRAMPDAMQIIEKAKAAK